MFDSRSEFPLSLAVKYVYLFEIIKKLNLRDYKIFKSYENLNSLKFYIKANLDIIWEALAYPFQMLLLFALRVPNKDKI